MFDIVYMSVTLQFTYYQTNKTVGLGTAMLEPYDPDDWKRIEITFVKENDEDWVLQQPTERHLHIYKISDPATILKQIQNKATEEKLEPGTRIIIKSSGSPKIERTEYTAQSRGGGKRKTKRRRSRGGTTRKNSVWGKNKPLEKFWRELASGKKVVLVYTIAHSKRRP